MIKVYSRHYVFYHEIEDDNIRRIIDDYQVLYGNYNDVCFKSLLETVADSSTTEDFETLRTFMRTNAIQHEYLIDMSMI